MAGTTVTTVDYLGELFQSGKRPNSMLKLCGYFANQVQETTSRVFPIGVFYSLRTPAQPAVLEGANAPAAQTRALTQATNVIQIHQETVSLSYLAASDKTVGGVVPIPTGRANGQVQSARSMAFQVKTILDTISQDLNFSFLNGVYNLAADPSSQALQTRGILTAIVTNAIDHSSDAVPGTNALAAAQYRGYVDLAVQQMVTSNGYQVDDTYALFAGPQEYANIANSFAVLGTLYLQPETMVAGVKIRKILTTFGELNLVLDPDMPAQTLGIFNMGMIGPVGMPVEGKGILFEEPLAKVGSADQSQIYGQLGLDHGPEYLHAKVKVPAMTITN